MKQPFWKADRFPGLLIAPAFLFAARSDLLQSLERKAYDLGVQTSNRTLGLAFLQKQPELRFQTGADLARAIRACAAFAAKEK
ncbi:hypothetical protein SCD_n02384 [Sulfuricella denitrificans skB26]|uniref:Uncharacterized protein n=1 Tax=Sulfuricella denitrificans (strain DSM 22764 / NBRC 105220 / skB26) TaxID=1163617 RepID=S6B6R6_SULDS|nr:hypothetical protein [Sulfuricella denitrificans]BAN36192.1 hypothetical protein SCD_n02384 [Sulfuricella denitrificans skB26]